MKGLRRAPSPAPRTRTTVQEAAPPAQTPAGDRLGVEMRVHFDAEEMAAFFEAFDPLENPFDPPPRQLPDRRPTGSAAKAA